MENNEFQDREYFEELKSILELPLTDEEKKERLLDEKIALFFKATEKLKKNKEDFDYYGFLKHKEIGKDDKINRLINFNENINN